MRTLPLALGVAIVLLGACATSPPPPSTAMGMRQAPAGATGPVRNAAAKAGEEITTIRYWKIRKGCFPQFLKASREQIWPFFEKIGARIVGMWEVVPGPEGPEGSLDYDEVYLMTRYASLEHWSATRDAARMGGDGPDYRALQAGLAVRQSLTIESKVTYMRGVTGPLGPVFMPGTGEKFVPAPVAGKGDAPAP